MRISEAESTFRAFLQRHGKAPDELLPEDLLALGFAFYETERVIDALPANEDSFGDALLFQWGIREALLPHYDECYYVDLTRQFISKDGEDDDAMFQLTCQLQYELGPELRRVETGNRWCASLGALPEFKAFALAHPALAAVAGKAPGKVEFYLTPV